MSPLCRRTWKARTDVTPKRGVIPGEWVHSNSVWTPRGKGIHSSLALRNYHVIHVHIRAEFPVPAQQIKRNTLYFQDG